MPGFIRAQFQHILDAGSSKSEKEFVQEGQSTVIDFLQKYVLDAIARPLGNDGGRAAEEDVGNVPLPQFAQRATDVFEFVHEGYEMPLLAVEAVVIDAAQIAPIIKGLGILGNVVLVSLLLELLLLLHVGDLNNDLCSRILHPSEGMRRGGDATLQAAHGLLHPRSAILLLVALLLDSGLPGRQLSYEPILPPTPLGPNDGAKVAKDLLPLQRRVVLELRRTAQIDQRVDPDLVHENGQIGLGGVGNPSHPVDGVGLDGTSGHAGQIAGVLHLLEGEVALLAQGFRPGEEVLLLLGEFDVLGLRHVDIVVGCRRCGHERSGAGNTGSGNLWKKRTAAVVAAATPHGAEIASTGSKCRYGSAAADRSRRCGGHVYCCRDSLHHENLARTHTDVTGTSLRYLARQAQAEVPRNENEAQTMRQSLKSRNLGDLDLLEIFPFEARARYGSRGNAATASQILAPRRRRDRNMRSFPIWGDWCLR